MGSSHWKEVPKWQGKSGNLFVDALNVIEIFNFSNAEKRMVKRWLTLFLCLPFACTCNLQLLNIYIDHARTLLFNTLSASVVIIYINIYLDS